MMTLCLLLTACGGTGGEAGDAADARMPYRNMAGCVMEAEVSCTQDGAAWEATLQCDYVPEGETTVEVLAPETIAGVKAVLSDGEVELVYEDQCLNAGNLSRGNHLMVWAEIFCQDRKGWQMGYQSTNPEGELHPTLHHFR